MLDAAVPSCTSAAAATAIGDEERQRQIQPDAARSHHSPGAGPRLEVARVGERSWSTSVRSRAD